MIIKNVKDKNPRNHLVGTTPLHLAATRSHLEVCKLIIEFIENKNSQNKWNGTPLHEAAGYGHLQVCKLIIENIEDKNPKNNLGDTPLHLAAKSGHFEVCKLIIENTEDINPKNDFFWLDPPTCSCKEWTFGSL